MYKYTSFNCYHQDYPQNVVEVEAFGNRGAAIKTRKILSSMHLISRKEDIKNIKVEAM